jgi:hypothetical protein
MHNSWYDRPGFDTALTTTQEYFKLLILFITLSVMDDDEGDHDDAM